jgi:hypothetical protein
MTLALAIPDAEALTGWSDQKLDNAIRRGVTKAGKHMAQFDQMAVVTGYLLMERAAAAARGNSRRGWRRTSMAAGGRRTTT